MDGSVLNVTQDDYRFPVKELPLVALGNNNQYPIDAKRFKAVVRTDTEEVLGVHSGKYNLVKHEDIVNGIMEGREWIYESGIWQEKQIERAKKIIHTSSKRDLEKNIVRVFKEYFKNI